MATIDLGRLGFVNKGTYNNSTTYEKNDLVQFTDGGILSTYLYIDSTAQSGQAPSSSGTAGSRWVYFAKGVADAIASAGNNKVLVTDGSGGLSPLSIGSAGQILKVNSGANGFEFGADQGGKIGQVLHANLTTAFTSSTNTPVDITNMSIDITPASSGSKMFITCDCSMLGHDASSGAFLILTRTIGGTATQPIKATGGGWTTTKNAWGASGGGGMTDNARKEGSPSMNFLDSPNTTSQINYKLQLDNNSNGNIARVNQWSLNNDHQGVTTMTIMEVLA